MSDLAGELRARTKQLAIRVVKWPGYIPDLRNAAYGGYGAGVTNQVEIGAAERIMERHRIHLYRRRGMWRDKPGLP